MNIGTDNTNIASVDEQSYLEIIMLQLFSNIMVSLFGPPLTINLP